MLRCFFVIELLVELPNQGNEHSFAVKLDTKRTYVFTNSFNDMTSRK